MKEIQVLLQKASVGIIFHDNTKREVGDLLESIAESNPFDKLIGIIGVFRKLALSKDFELLNKNNPTLLLKKQDNDKIDRVYSYVKEHFQEDIKLDDISRLVSMQIPSFCRYFKRVNRTIYSGHLL